jgi:hypothetical protein
LFSLFFSRLAVSLFPSCLTSSVPSPFPCTDDDSGASFLRAVYGTDLTDHLDARCVGPPCRARIFRGEHMEQTHEWPWSQYDWKPRPAGGR